MDSKSFKMLLEIQKQDLTKARRGLERMHDQTTEGSIEEITLSTASDYVSAALREVNSLLQKL